MNMPTRLFRGKIVTVCSHAFIEGSCAHVYLSPMWHGRGDGRFKLFAHCAVVAHAHNCKHIAVRARVSAHANTNSIIEDSKNGRLRMCTITTILADHAFRQRATPGGVE